MIYKFEITVLNKTFQCRAFTLREYKDLMEAKANGTLASVVTRIINDCTDARNLNKQESELLLVKLWAHSIGEVNTQATWVCPCGKELSIPVNLTHAQVDSPEELVRDFGAFKIKFRYPKFFEDKEQTKMIVQCIDYIIVGNERLKVDDLTEQELQDLYNAITYDDIKAITEMLLKPTIYLAVPISCECGNKHIHVIKGLKEFFRLL